MFQKLRGARELGEPWPRPFLAWAFYRVPYLPAWLLWRMARYLNRTMVIPKPDQPGYAAYFSFLDDDLKALEPKATS